MSAMHRMASPPTQRYVDTVRAAIERKRAGRPWPSLVVLLGIGDGTALAVIEREAPAGTRILAIEPFRANAAAVLLSRERQEKLEKGVWRVLVGPEYAGSADAWRMIDSGAAPLIFPDPALVSTHANDVLTARRVFDRIFVAAHENAKARQAFAGRYLVNTLANVQRMRRAPDLRAWLGTRRRCPAVVCGAGPSLNRNLQALATRRDRVVLVAADTALRPVLEAGLVPDFVVALDPTPLNARHLSSLGGLTRTWLVSESAVDRTAFDSFGDRIAFFRVGNHDPWPWLASHGLNTPVLAAWGSVLTSAFEFATWLGCSPIMFMGADLSYADGQPYCRGTMFEADWARVVLEGQPLPLFWRKVVSHKSRGRIEGVGGTEFDTSPHLLSFRDWFVERAATAKRRIVNLSGSGVLVGAGIEQGDPTLLDQLPLRTIEAGTPAAMAPRATTTIPLADGPLNDASEPLAGWIARCSPNLDREALERALRDITFGNDHVTVEALPERGRRGLIALPEAVAIIRAAREGVPPPAWASESAAWSYRGDPPGSQRSQLNALLQLAHLTSATAERHAMNPAAGHLEHLFTLGLSQPAFEMLAVYLIETASTLRANQPRETLRQRIRRAANPEPRVPAPESRVPDPESRIPDPESLAQLFIASMVATAEAARADDRASRCLLDAIDAAFASSFAREASSLDATLTLAVTDTGDQRAWDIAFSLPPERRADVLRGGLFTDGGRSKVERVRDGVRLAFDAPGQSLLDWAPFRALTDEGLPKCLIANPLGSNRAIVTPRGQRASFIVDSIGGFSRGDDWPQPITGEVHGVHGAMAWTHTVPSVLLFRRLGTAEIIAETVSFQPYTAIWRGDEVLLTGNAGVWSWRPGERPRQVAAVPPAVIVEERDGVLSVDPLPVVDGRLVRATLTTGWDIEIASGAVIARSLTAQGQSWCRAAGACAVVTTYPDTDAVVLSLRTDVAPVTLAWPRPRTAVWLGSSLLINTALGEVVLFDDVVSVIRRSSQ